MEARLRYYLRPGFEDSGEYVGRRFDRRSIRQLLDWVVAVQKSQLIERLGFREADTFCKIDDDALVVEWESAAQTFTLLINPDEVVAMLITTDPATGTDIQHGITPAEGRDLFETFCLNDHP